LPSATFASKLRIFGGATGWFGLDLWDRRGLRRGGCVGFQLASNLCKPSARTSSLQIDDNRIRGSDGNVNDAVRAPVPCALKVIFMNKRLRVPAFDLCTDRRWARNHTTVPSSLAAFTRSGASPSFVSVMLDGGPATL
jgi:hypothetical protein